MTVGVVAHVDRHPRPIRVSLRILTQQHHLDAVLPRPHILLVRGLDRADVVGGQARDRLPATAALGGLGERALDDELAHRVAGALGRPVGVLFVGVAVLVEHRTPRPLLRVHVGQHGRQAGGDDHPADALGPVDAGNCVIAHHLHVIHIVVLTDVRHVTHAVAAGEGLVETAGLGLGRRCGWRVGPTHSRASVAGT